MEYDSSFNYLNLDISMDKLILSHIDLSIKQLKGKYPSAISFERHSEHSLTINIKNSFFNRFFYRLNNNKILLFLKEVNSINENIFITNKNNTFYFKYISNDKAKIVKNIDNF